MIESMNDNQMNVLGFPIQITDTPGLEQSDDQLACEVRMALVHKINEANAGRYQLTERDIYNIKRVNPLFRKYGYQAIDIDLSQF